MNHEQHQNLFTTVTTPLSKAELRRVTGGYFSVLRVDRAIKLDSQVAAIVDRHPGINKMPPDLTLVFDPVIPDPGPY